MSERGASYAQLVGGPDEPPPIGGLRKPEQPAEAPTKEIRINPKYLVFGTCLFLLGMVSGSVSEWRNPLVGKILPATFGPPTAYTSLPPTVAPGPTSKVPQGSQTVVPSPDARGNGTHALVQERDTKE